MSTSTATAALPKFKQRWLHFYFMNELTYLAIIWYCRNRELPFHWFPFGLCLVFVHYAVLWVWATVRMLFDHGYCPTFCTSLEKHPLPTFRTFSHVTRDGVKIKVHVTNTSGKKVMLLAKPLGASQGTGIFSPIMSCFGPQFTYVTWDYRGLFGSDKLAQPRGLAINEHAKDALEVLHAAGFKQVDVMVGHSLGTAVTLEAALLFPHCIKAIVVMNGFHGHVFSTAFQPLVRWPFMGDFISEAVEAVLRNQSPLRSAGGQSWALTSWAISSYTRIFGSAWVKQALGNDYLLDFLKRYISVLTTDSLESSLRLFQELDAHSVYHLLPTITHPMLIISGFWDMFTPALQSVEISRRVPHSVHYMDPLSSHCTPLESPERCLGAICSFFEVLNRR